MRRLAEQARKRALARLVRRIYRNSEGGTTFGVDLPTLRIVDRAAYDEYVRLSTPEELQPLLHQSSV